MKNSSGLEKHFVFVTSVLVALLGVPAVNSMLKNPHIPDTVTIKDPVKQQRQPASVNLVRGMTPQNGFSKSVSLDLACKGKSDLGLVQGMHLRFKGTFCGEQSAEVAIKNMTNGFTAAVIPLSDGKFTTDYMDLSEGENKIQVLRKNSEGTTDIREIFVHRAPALESN